MKSRFFKLAWMGGVCAHVLVMLYLVWKGKFLHIGGSPYELLYLYAPLGLLGVVGLGLSLRDAALLRPASMLLATSIMGCLLAFFLDRTGILRTYSSWVRTMPEISFGAKLACLAGYSLIFATVLVLIHRLTAKTGGKD